MAAWSVKRARRSGVGLDVELDMVGGTVESTKIRMVVISDSAWLGRPTSTKKKELGETIALSESPMESLAH
jgi:hypothetical protein